MVSVNGTSGVNSDYTIKKRNQETNVQNTSNETSIFNVSNPDTKAVSTTSETQNVNLKKIEEAKTSCEADFPSLKASGVNVSEWDKNNTCTLSFGQYKAVISISSDGNSRIDGDIVPIMEHVKNTNPEEAESVSKQNSMIEKQEKSGDPIVGKPNLINVKVNGKSVPVNEYTTKSGNKLYLDGKGNEVTPDS